jgi:hypothetical protein
MGVGFAAVAASQIASEIQTPAKSGTPGAVTMQPAIADLAAAPTEADFNGLLAALRLAGVISPT